MGSERVIGIMCLVRERVACGVTVWLVGVASGLRSLVPNKIMRKVCTLPGLDDDNNTGVDVRAGWHERSYT